MRKKKNALYLVMIIVFLLVDMLFFWNSIQDVMFVSHIQETTGTIIRIEEQTHDWNIGKRCEFSYTVDGIHYRGAFTSYSIGALSDISLGKQIVVSYSAENPSNVKQGSVVRNIGIIVLKCSAYILTNMEHMVKMELMKIRNRHTENSTNGMKMVKHMDGGILKLFLHVTNTVTNLEI